MTNKQKTGDFFANLAWNIIIPFVIMTRFSGANMLGPVIGLIVALAFPLGWSAYGFFRERGINYLSLIGVASILMTGGVGLLKLPATYLAIKEALVPFVTGIVLFTMHRFRPHLFQSFVFTDALFETETIEKKITETKKQKEFARLFNNAMYIFLSSFLLSTILNYALAKILVISEPGTEAFVAEIGTMSALSYPIIVIPSLLIFATAIWFLLSGLRKMTGLPIEKLIK